MRLRDDDRLATDVERATLLDLWVHEDVLSRGEEAKIGSRCADEKRPHGVGEKCIHGLA